jgi:hypothetical protein
MKRKKDWVYHFARYVNSQAYKEFEYGYYDCAIFVLGAVKAMTGKDLLKDKSIKYRNLKEAVEIIKRYGDSYKEATANFAKNAGLIEIQPLNANKGDIVLVEDISGEYILGLVDLDGWRCLVLSSTGLNHIALDKAILAWRI